MGSGWQKMQQRPDRRGTKKGFSREFKWSRAAVCIKYFGTMEEMLTQ